MPYNSQLHEFERNFAFRPKSWEWTSRTWRKVVRVWLLWLTPQLSPNCLSAGCGPYFSSPCSSSWDLIQNSPSLKQPSLPSTTDFQSSGTIRYFLLSKVAPKRSSFNLQQKVKDFEAFYKLSNKIKCPCHGYTVCGSISVLLLYILKVVELLVNYLDKEKIPSNKNVPFI